MAALFSRVFEHPTRQTLSGAGIHHKKMTLAFIRQAPSLSWDVMVCRKKAAGQKYSCNWD
jgi:hypothetical protein